VFKTNTMSFIVQPTRVDANFNPKSKMYHAYKGMPPNIIFKDVGSAYTHHAVATIKVPNDADNFRFGYLLNDKITCNPFPNDFMTIRLGIGECKKEDKLFGPYDDEEHVEPREYGDLTGQPGYFTCSQFKDWQTGYVNLDGCDYALVNIYIRFNLCSKFGKSNIVKLAVRYDGKEKSGGTGGTNKQTHELISNVFQVRTKLNKNFLKRALNNGSKPSKPFSRQKKIKLSHDKTLIERISEQEVVYKTGINGLKSKLEELFKVVQPWVDEIRNIREELADTAAIVKENTGRLRDMELLDPKTIEAQFGNFSDLPSNFDL